MTTITSNLLPLVALGLGLAGLTVSMALDRLVRPRGAGYLRPGPAIAIHAGLFVGLWAFLWLIGDRAGFALALTLASQYLLVAVNNAKFLALREPFVFSDFGLFSQAFRFPRLYLPFLTVAQAMAAGFGLAAAAGIGLFLEGSSPGGREAAAVLLAGALGLLLIGTRLAPVPCLDPVADLAKYGLLPSLWLYWRAEWAPAPIVPVRPWLEQAPGCWTGLDRAALPDVLLVQSESFFDVRRLYCGVRPDVLRHFDALSTQARAQGRLEVPAWGANTMRTEFAVLTGIPQTALGVHRFNPYRRFVRTDLLALPQQLRRLGYRTICIHPHPAGFFGRNRIFPRLGFDAFIDTAAFVDARRVGPYVADAAVTEKIAELLAEAQGPIFIFAITMENHGPLHLEQVDPGDVHRLYMTPPPEGWEDLTIYLRHLANADQMLGDLARLVRSHPRPGLLGWFGDHVPSLPRVYEHQAFADGRTDYLIWNGVGAGLTAVDLDAHQMPVALLATLAETVGAAEGMAMAQGLLPALQN